MMFLFETTAERMRRYGAKFGWQVERLEKEGKLKFVACSPEDVLKDLESETGLMISQIAAFHAQRVVFAGFAPLRIASQRNNVRSFRESVYVLFNLLREKRITAMFTTESAGTNPIGEAGSHGEHYLSDSVFTIRNQARRRSVHRSIEITKSRGQDFMSGRHSLKIVSGTGLEVYTRVSARPRELNEQPTSSKRVSTGNVALDEMVGGGQLECSVTLVVGISGTGKTIAGIQFLTAAARDGHKDLFVDSVIHEF